ncbi:Ig-like domain-containing protein [Bordetella bronchiseptica]|uniref:Ig-like domain-containing protein n=1 Tax=Bordetella bronchiseptica TaxID=518 RepID=UPI0037D2313A
MDMNLILKLTRAHLPARGRRHRYRRHRAAAAGMSAVLAMQAAAPVAYGQGAPTFSATQAADAASNAVAQPGAVETRVAQTIQALAQAREAGGARQDARASLDGQFLRSQAQAQANVLVQQGVQWANETGLPWLRRLEGNVSYDFSGRDVAVDVRTIDALHLDQDRALLLQLGGHNQNHRPTVNAGVVARSAAGSSLILGGNAFLDYEVGKRHLRGSLGAEAVAPQFTLYGNVYAPLSGWKAAKRAERREERPAAGWDVGLTARPEAVQGLALNAQYFRWRGAQVDYFDDGRYRRNPSGFKYGIEYRPVPLIGVGVEQARLQSGERQTSVQLGVRLNLGEPLSRQLRRGAQDTAPPFDSGARLQDFVRRENRIVLDTRRKKIVLALRIAEVRTDPATGRITVYGVTEPLADVQLWLPDGTATSVRANAAGGFEASSAGDMTSGLIRARSTDRYGDTSQEVTYAYTDTVDKTAPVLSIAGVATDEATGRVTVTGRSEPDAQVTIRFPGGGRKTVRADANGAYRVRSDGDLPAGVIVVQAADAAGNSTQAQQAYQDTVDRTAPEPVQIALDTDAATGRLTVSGQAEPGGSVTVTWPDGTTQTVRVDADGGFRVTSAGDAAQGDVVVVVADQAGNRAAPVRAHYADPVDRTAPMTPTVRHATDAQTGRVTVMGRTEAGALVTVQFPDGSSKTVRAQNDGGYAATSDTDMVSGPIMVSAGDAYGNASAPVHLPYQDQVDKTAPASPSLTVREDAASGRATVTGQAEPGAAVRVVFPNGEAQTVTAGSDGAYSVTSAADMVAGEITAVAADASGNQSAPARTVFADAVDKTAPAAPTLALNEAAASGRLTVSGRTEPGASVRVTFPDGETVTVTAKADGTYTATSRADMIGGNVTVVATDTAGNAAAPVRAAYADTVDRTPPVLDTPVLSVASDSGRVTVTGVTEPGARVQVAIPGEAPQTVTADSAGRYRAVSPGDVLQSGTVRVIATDAHGNASAPRDVPYQDAVDRTAPPLTIDAAVEQARTGVVNVSGKTEPNLMVSATFPDGQTAQARADGQGRYQLASPADVARSGRIAVSASDAAGNRAAASAEFTDQVDKTAPRAPTLQLATDTATGRVTASGKAEPGATVEITWPDQTRVTVVADTSGAYSATSAADMPDGAITAVAADRAGNTGAPTRQRYIDSVDRTAPTLGTPSVSTAADTGRVSVTGMTEPGARVQVEIPGEAPRIVTADAAGRYSVVSAGDVLQSGTVRVTATDAYGNASAPVHLPYQDQVDKTAPASPSLTVREDAASGRATVTGQAEPGAAVRVVFPNGEAQTVTAGSDGAYSVTSAADMVAGEITAVAADASGNQSAPARTVFADAVDKTAPAAPTLALNEAAASGRLTVSGRTEPGASVRVTFPDGETVTVTAKADGTYTATSRADMIGGNVTVVATDTAGNAAAPVRAAYADTVDRTPPVLDTPVLSVASDSGRVTVTGVTEPGARVQVAIPGEAPQTVTADSAGRYRAVSPGDVLQSGTVRVIATDAHGNASAPRDVPYQDAVDRTAPPLTIDAAVEQARTGVVNVSGKTEPNLMVSATFPDGQTAQARADGQGRYQLASPADVARSGRIAVSVSDAAGNRAAASAEFTDQVDKTAPAVTIRAVTEQAGTGVATVSGTTEPGATVSVTFPDGQVARATADRSGAYTVHSARDVTARGNISVVATDAAGNASPSVSRQFSNTVADMVPPSLTIAMVTTDPSDGRITVSGVTEAGARVHVVFPGGASDTVTADSKGGYRATSAGDVGSGAVTAQATDASANRSPLKTYAYTDAWQPRKLSAKDFGQSRYFVPLSTRGGTDNEPLLRITNQQIPTAELRVALKPYKTEDRAGRLVREAIELKWGDAPGVGGDARALHFYVPASAKAKLRKELTDVERSNDYKFWIEFTDTRFGGVARLYIKVISTL